MATTVAPSRVARPIEAYGRQKGWGWPQYLASAGVLFLVWETWTLVAWLADGPHFITKYRDTRGLDWWAARGFEVVAVVGATLALAWVIRGCFRARKLTFDAMFCIAALNTWWANDSFNFVLPIYNFSSNWTAVNSPCGNMPFVINPDCGRMANPIVFFVPFWAGLLVLSAALMGALLRPIRSRWPDLSKAKLVLLCFAIGIGFDVALEFSAIAMGLWTYFSPDNFSIVINGGGGNRYALSELISGGIWWSLVCMVRVFKDDKGLSFVERGLSHLSHRRQVLTTQLALIGFINLTVWTVATLPLVAYGPYMDPIKPLPRHLVNDICNTPGVEHTRYGTCPGTPGFRMPMRTLSGESP